MNTSRRVATDIPLSDYKSTGAVGTISVHRVVELAHEDDAPHTVSLFPRVYRHSDLLISNMQKSECGSESRLSHEKPHVF